MRGDTKRRDRFIAAALQGVMANTGLACEGVDSAALAKIVLDVVADVMGAAELPAQAFQCDPRRELLAITSRMRRTEMFKEQLTAHGSPVPPRREWENDEQLECRSGSLDHPPYVTGGLLDAVTQNVEPDDAGYGPLSFREAQRARETANTEGVRRRLNMSNEELAAHGRQMHEYNGWTNPEFGKGILDAIATLADPFAPGIREARDFLAHLQPEPAAVNGEHLIGA